MTSSRPAYINHVAVYRHGLDRADQTAVVVLLPSARALLPRHFQDSIADIPSDEEVRLGIVTSHPSSHPTSRTGFRLRLWRFTRNGQADAASSQSYYSRHDAAESCAVEAIDGAHTRHHFDLARWNHRRPCDN